MFYNAVTSIITASSFNSTISGSAQLCMQAFTGCLEPVNLDVLFLHNPSLSKQGINMH
jgi:hypothetical protein